MRILFIITLCVVSLEANSVFELPLDPLKRFNLYWTPNYPTETITFELRLQLRNDEFFGFGFSDRGNVTDADLCVLWSDKTQNTRFDDVWTDSGGYMSVDDHNDCLLESIERKANVLRILFNRRFDTCDHQDYQIQDGTVHLIYIVGEGPLRRLEGLRVSDLENGFQRAQLLKNTQPTAPPPRDTTVTHFTSRKVLVPPEETTYWCTLHKFPAEFRKKRHIVRYEALIQKGSESLVHHMELFHCEVPPSEKLPSWNNHCAHPEKPQILERCKRVVAAWAMGAPPLIYPQEAGLPVGGEDWSTYVMLEVHYNNPAMQAGVIDSSGITLYHTAELRKYDIGILEAGLEYTDKMGIPPAQYRFPLKGFCISECTRVGIPSDGITIFAAQLHTHLTGRSVRVQHIRNGVQLPDMAYDSHFSTHFQEIRPLKRHVQLFPGDALTVICNYDTRDRSNITLGGFGIREEMCVTYIHYYPKTDLEVCKSSVDTDTLLAYFKYMNREHGERTSNRLGISDNYKSIHWTPYNVEFLNKFYNTMPLSMQCNQSSGQRFPGYWENMVPTQVIYPQKPEKRHCPKKPFGPKFE